MSDPVKNAEVEDVLSSIRRLVSEDKRPLQPPSKEPAADRLVLTPALRVAETPPPAEAAEPMEDHGIDDDPAEDAVSEPPVAASLENEADAQHDEVAADDPAEDYTTDPYNFDDEADKDGERDTAAANRPMTFEPGPEVGLTRADYDQNAADDVTDHDEIEGHVEAEREDLTPTTPMDTPQEALKAATLSAKIEALETAIGSIADTWEPDGSGTDEYAGTQAPAMAWEDDVAQTPKEPSQSVSSAPEPEAPEPEATEPEQTPEPVSAPASQETPGDAMDLTDEDQLIDEEALRDLVSEIVRSELQGALGERITRNVRKLVRREIHRALTAQDLE